MQNFESGVINKKVLFAAGITILVLIPIIILLETDNKAVTPPETDLTITSIPSKTTEKPEQEATVKWQNFTNADFTMQYPPEWRVEQVNAQTGDLTLIIKPDILPQGLYYPQFILQVQHNVQNAMQNKQGILEGFKMKKSTTTVNESEAIQYRGTLPFKTKNGKTVKEPIQDTTVLYQDGTTLYTFKYEYEGSKQDKTLEAFLDEIIKTFKTSE